MNRGSVTVTRAAASSSAVAFVDVEELWCKVDWRSEDWMESRTVKEKAFRAAYDAPFHGVPSGPYMGGRVADMNTHIAERHREFLIRARRALCGHEVTPDEFADAVSRLCTLLGISVDAAVTCVFGEPRLLAANESDIIGRLVELRAGHEGVDLADLVVCSRGRLLREAAEVLCCPEEEEDAKDDYEEQHE